MNRRQFVGILGGAAIANALPGLAAVSIPKTVVPKDTIFSLDGDGYIYQISVTSAQDYRGYLAVNRQDGAPVVQLAPGFKWRTFTWTGLPGGELRFTKTSPLVVSHEGLEDGFMLVRQGDTDSCYSLESDGSWKLRSLRIPFNATIPAPRLKTHA